MISTLKRRICAGVLLATLPALVLSGCGGSNNSSSGNQGSDATNIAFDNTYSGKIALRTPDTQLSGDFATVSLTLATNNQVNGKVSIAPEAGGAAIISSPSKIIYQNHGIESHAGTNGTINIVGTADSQAGTFTATGTGNDVDGVPTTVTLQGTLQQQSTTQLASTSISTKTATTTTTGAGVLPGAKKKTLPSKLLLPPILTGDLKVPQGVTVRFKPTGADQPANPDATETGDVVNFTLPNYHSPDFDGYSNIDNGGWIFSYDGTYITLTVPKEAPITTGYEIRDRSTGTPVSANFEVIKCPLQKYTAGVNYIGSDIWADVDFFPSLAKIDAAAGAAHVKVFITGPKAASFRVSGKSVGGAVVSPSEISNHFIGHAIDMNVQYTDSAGVTHLATSSVLSQDNLPAPVDDFITRVQSSGLRWGGDFSPADVVHFDDGLNVSNKSLWDQKYGIMQQCAKTSGFPFPNG